jgi:hypothetical protein
VLRKELGRYFEEGFPHEVWGSRIQEGKGSKLDEEQSEEYLDSLDNEGILHEIDTSLMTFQHIKSKE